MSPDDEPSNLDPLFKPKSVAIIGVSDDPLKFSSWIIPGMKQIGYSGKIFPVNPKRPEISGIKCYDSISNLPEIPDLAIIIIPSSGVKQVLQECIRIGVKATIVITAEVEFGTAQPEVERTELLAQAHSSGMRICGPNCEGVIHLGARNWATFLSHTSPIRGNIAFVTQSGGVGEFVLHKLWERKAGASGWVSSGNEMDLQVADYIEYFAKDPDTKVISVFLEAVRDGPRFIRAAKTAFEARKPLVILKVGRSEQGRKTALTHTGAIAGKYGVYMGLFRQLGIVRARSIQELVDLPLALAWEPLPAGNRLGIVADSGGIAAVFADQADQEGLTVPDFEDQTREELAKVLPSLARANNPLDITALVGPKEFPDSLESIARIILQDRNCDMLILGISYWPQEIFSDVLRALERLHKIAGGKVSKPILPVLTAITSETHRELLSEAAEFKLPVYLTPEAAIAGARALYEYSQARRQGLDL
ncbi:MAG: CoA-binding protein [Candidatus Bathyarchaeia archaeon]|jgi:acetyltransferase